MSLLKPHIPYEDRRFPGRNYKQIASLEVDDDEWAVEKIAGHRGKGNNAIFEIVWQSGDRTWETYHVVRHLEALRQYFEALGIKRAKDLPWKEDGEPPYNKLSDSGSETLEGTCMRVLKGEETEDSPLTSYSDHQLPTCLNSSIAYRLTTSCLTDAIAGVGDAFATTPPATAPSNAATISSATSSGCSTLSLKLTSSALSRKVPTARPTSSATPNAGVEEAFNTVAMLRSDTELKPTSATGLATATKDGDASVDVFDLILGPLVPPQAVDLQVREPAPPLEEDALPAQGYLVPDVIEDEQGALPPTPFHTSVRAHAPGPVRIPALGPVLVPAPAPMYVGRQAVDPTPAIPDPTERVRLVPPLRPAPDPMQRGAIALQINDLSAKVSQAIQLVENIISVSSTLNERVKRAHQCVVDREWDIMEDLTRLTLRAMRVQDEPRIGDPTYPRELLNRAYPPPPSMPEETENQIDDLISGIVDHWSTIRGHPVTLHRQATIGIGAQTGANGGTGGGTQPPHAEQHDCNDVGDVTDHVARWTTLGTEGEARIVPTKALRTVEPEQRCVSPKDLQLN
ncbi:hypothetical protein FRC11_005984 [Ceratobasidium sp. 423]|nr:hypothetical protein FRC11_005984 [Ceratobasidium sp. 423]